MKRVLSSIRVFLAFSLIAMAGNSCGQSSTTAATGVEGTIKISPRHPGPTRINEDNSGPMSDMPFVVENESGKVTTFTTDAQGSFRISLKPGRYKISAEGQYRPRRCGPFDVEVSAGQMTKVEWRCDSGMR